MKRKPNKPRPESQTHTEPGNGAAEPEGSAFGAGSEQEPGAAGHFGTKCPKVKIPAEKPAGTSGGIQAPHGKAGRKTGGRPGKAGKAEAAQTKRPDP